MALSRPPGVIGPRSLEIDGDTEPGPGRREH